MPELNQVVIAMQVERLSPPALVDVRLGAAPAARHVDDFDFRPQMMFDPGPPAVAVRHRRISDEDDPDFRSRFSGFDRLAVDEYVAKHNVLHALKDVRLRHVIESAIFYQDVCDLRILEAAHVEGILALPADHIFHADVAHDGSEAALLPFLVIEINGDDSVGDLAHHDIPHVDVFEQAAAHGVVLKTQSAVEVGAVHTTVLREDVADAARNLAPDSDAAVPVLHPATLNDDVLGGDVDAPPVRVPPALDRYAVVARVEGAVLDEHVQARFGIAPVVVGPMTVDRHPLHSDVRAEHRMNLPHGRVRDRDAFDKDVLTAVGLNELRSQVVAFAEHTLAHRHVLFHHLRERVARLQLVRVAFLPPALGAALPRPPVRCVALAVERAFARDGDVLLLEGVDEGRVVHQLHPLPTREDQRQILRGVLTELDGASRRDVQVDVTQQVNRAGQKRAGRHDDAASASFGTRGDGLTESLCAIRCAVILSAEASDIEIAPGKNRRLDAL